MLPQLNLKGFYSVPSFLALPSLLCEYFNRGKLKWVIETLSQNPNQTYFKFQCYFFSVIPAKAGIQECLLCDLNSHWIPAGVYPELDTGRE